jgi:hypothetical protein
MVLMRVKGLGGRREEELQILCLLHVGRKRERRMLQQLGWSTQTSDTNTGLQACPVLCAYMPRSLLQALRETTLI